MNLKRLAVGFFVLVIFPALLISGQTPNDNFKTFNQGGLKFGYPADWVLTAKSNPYTQHIQLTKPDTLSLIALIAPAEAIVTWEQYTRLQDSVNDSYVRSIKANLRPSAKTIEEQHLCLDFNGRNVPGVRFIGLFNDEPSAGEIYSFILGNRLLTLIYMRSDRDKAAGDAAWRQVIASLYLANSHKEMSVPFTSSNGVESGILNGTALRLVVPEYPNAAKSRGISGAVNVRVLIDETGKVVEAKAEKGDVHLAGAAVQAAKASIFKPTYLCDKLVKVSGVIVYNFN